MKILALEFSSPVRSVAVLGGPSPGAAEDLGTREMKPFQLIDAALAQAGLSREDIECIAVGLGPGSYAGIRTAIAMAQGWQMARGVKLLGLASAEVVAARGGKYGGAESVWVGLEAQRGELFVAEYDASVFERPRLLRPFQRSSRVELGGQNIFRMDWSPGTAATEGGTPLVPTAQCLALLAASRAEFVSGPVLEPVYLRAMDFVKAPVPRFFAD